MEPLQTIEVHCPYCGEAFTTCVDTSCLPQNYIEDCYVCCAPIVFDIQINPLDGELQFVVKQENE